MIAFISVAAMVFLVAIFAGFVLALFGTMNVWGFLAFLVLTALWYERNHHRRNFYRRR